MDGALGAVHGHVVVLVAVARVHHDGLVEVLDREPGAQLPLGVVVGAVRQARAAPASRRPPAARSRARRRSGTRPGSRGWRGRSWRSCVAPEVDVHRGDAAVGLHLVDPRLGHADARLRVAEVEEAARGAHGAEGGRGHHVHLARCLPRGPCVST